MPTIISFGKHKVMESSKVDTLVYGKALLEKGTVVEIKEIDLVRQRIITVGGEKLTYEEYDELLIKIQ